MMNIVGNQIIHEAADHYGWKEGSTEKLLLHGAIGALTGTMTGGNALSGAVSGSVNEFALAYMEKTKGKDWMDTPTLIPYKPSAPPWEPSQEA